MSKIAIMDFLRRCIEYSDDSMSRKRERGDSKELIAEWQAYRDYTQYALDELEKGDLDHWIESPFSPAENNLELDELDHLTRATWLSGILSPRPLALVSTTGEKGENIAPITSLTVVSNTPPLIVMSLSQNRNGTPRDTYLNLKENGECNLQFLAATEDAAKDVDLAGTPCEDSEWGLMEAEGPIHPLAVAILKCKMIEDRELPDGAVARLITLRVKSMTVSSYLPPEAGLNILCQHGLDRLTPSPNDWGYNATRHRS